MRSKDLLAEPLFETVPAGRRQMVMVAQIEDRVVGHIAFSPVSIAGGATGWYGLGPVSVLPEVFLALPFSQDTPRGTVTFHEGFLATE